MHTEVESQLSAGEDRRVALATSAWLNKVQEDANALLLSTLWRSEIARSHGAAQQSLGIRDNDDE